MKVTILGQGKMGPGHRIPLHVEEGATQVEIEIEGRRFLLRRGVYNGLWVDSDDGLVCTGYRMPTGVFQLYI